MSNGSTKAGSSKGSLLDRISGGQGKELLPGSSSAPKLHGFGATPQNLNNANAGVELLPSGAVRPRRSEPVLNKGRLVQSGLDAALGTSLPRRQVVRPIVPERGSVNILGAGRGTVLVMVENLAVGTTAEDVVVSGLILLLSPLPPCHSSSRSACLYTAHVFCGSLVG